ncbi:MAG TPA: DUF3137 domain-containing protein [Actinomycetes bacterium]|nr:DUF3137 domain-containing protein [Actinomycetes bacterium]
MSNASPLVFVVFLVVGAAFVVIGYLNNQKRIKAVEQFCVDRGWSYVAEAPQYVDRWQGHPFGTGERRRARNVMSGEWRGAAFVGFDYSYETTSTDANGRTNRTTHTFGVVALGLPTYLPTLQVTGESVLRRAAQAVGMGHDIDLESEDFNRAFTVTSPDPKFASDVLTPRTMEMLLAAPHLAWRIEGTDILSWATGAFSPVDVLQRLDHLSKVVAGVPSFVWHDHGYDPQQPAGGTGGGSAP